MSVPKKGYDPRQLVNVALDELAFGPNIRHDPGDLTTLTESIRKIGVLEPVLVCATGDGNGVEVLCGQRRVLASRQAGLTHVPCLVRPRPSETERVFLQLVENAERKDMSAIEHGDTFNLLCGGEYTATRIAIAMGRSNTWVQQRRDVARRPAFYRDAVHSGRMSLNLALDIPVHLAEDAKFTRELAPLLSLGEARVRDFTAARMNASPGAPINHNKRNGVLTQQVNVRLPYDTIRAARTAADAEGVMLSVWVTQAIHATLARDAKRAARGSARPTGTRSGAPSTSVIFRAWSPPTAPAPSRT